MVWQLKKALYGLKQASHLFEEHFSNILITDLAMKRVQVDTSLYYMRLYATIPREARYRQGSAIVGLRVRG